MALVKFAPVQIDSSQFVSNWKTVINASLISSPTNKTGVALGLTLRGTEARIGGHFPSIRYSINRVLIHFESNECSFPEDDWAYDAINLIETKVGREISESTETTTGAEGAWAGSVTASSISGGTNSSRSKSAKKGTSNTLRISNLHNPILAHGTATKPTWSLTSEYTHKPLLGPLLKTERFCRAEPYRPKPKIYVSFEIPYDALLFRKMDGSFVSGNKFGIIRLLLRATICERKQQICEMDIE